MGGVEVDKALPRKEEVEEEEGKEKAPVRAVSIWSGGR